MNGRKVYVGNLEQSTLEEVMYREINIAELLAEMKKRVGSVGRLAGLIGVSDKALREWLKKSEDELHRLHSDNIDSIIKTARSLKIEPELFAPPPLLWDYKKTYKENLLFDPGMPPHFPMPVKNHSFPFLGYPINSRFGASASVITSTSERIRFLAYSGVDVITYKTVRSDSYASHPPPNLFFCSRSPETMPKMNPDLPFPNWVIVGDDPGSFDPSCGMMNRYGMPSPPPEIWQADFRAAKRFMKPNQLLILSVVGTASRDSKDEVLIRDFLKVVGYALDADAEVIELNLSCPNCNGKEGQLYQNLPLVVDICEAVNRVAKGAKIILKIGFLREKELREFVLKTAAYVHGYSAINTIAVEGRRYGQEGLEPAYGKPDLKAGLSGAPILRYGLNCVKNLAKIKQEQQLDNIGIIGCGGVMTPADVQSYLNSGADVVQATTLFLVDSLAGIKVQEYLNSQIKSSEISAEQEIEIALVNWSKATQAIEREIERKYGRDDGFLSRIEEAALVDFREWERGHRATVALGPRRSSIPTVEDFDKRIRLRLQKP